MIAQGAASESGIYWGRAHFRCRGSGYAKSWRIGSKSIGIKDREGARPDWLKCFEILQMYG